MLRMGTKFLKIILPAFLVVSLVADEPWLDIWPQLFSAAHAQTYRIPDSKTFKWQNRADKPKTPTLSYKIGAPIRGLSISIYSTRSEALPRSGYKIYISRGDHTFDYAADAFAPVNRIRKPELLNRPALRQKPRAVARPGVRPYSNKIWIPRRLSNLSAPRKSSDGKWVVSASIDGLRDSTDYCIAAQTSTGVQEIGCSATKQYLPVPRALDIRDNGSGRDFRVVYSEKSTSESGVTVEMIDKSRQGFSHRYKHGEGDGEIRGTGERSVRIPNNLVNYMRREKGEWCFDVMLVRKQTDTTIRSDRSNRICHDFGRRPSETDDTDAADANSVKEILITNCDDSRRAVYVWGREISSSGSRYTRRNTVDSDWQGLSCPGTNGPTKILVPHGKVTDFVIVNPELLSCQAGNNPNYGGCLETSIIRAKGHRNGKSLPLTIQ